MGIGKTRHWVFNHELYSTKKEPKYAEYLYAEKKNLNLLKKNNLLHQIVNLYDREYDDVKWFNYLRNKSVSFIIRGKEKRNIGYSKNLSKIKVSKTEVSRKQYFKPLIQIEKEIKYEEHPEFPGTEKRSGLKVGFSKILVKHRGYGIKKKDIQKKKSYYEGTRKNLGKTKYTYISLNLIIVKLPKSRKLKEDMESNRNEGKIYLYTNLPVKNTHQAMIVFFLYLER